jgi:prepilin-type N-terminal cleavage/methylation domain-containing protein
MIRIRHRHSAGFSLIELMVVLVVMGLMAAAAAPSIGLIQADNRQVSATMDLVRFSRRARALTRSTGVAHLLRFQAASSNGLGQMGLFAGMTARCQQTPWNLAFTAPVNSPLLAFENFDMAFYNRTAPGVAPRDNDSGRHVIHLRAAQPPTLTTDIAALQLCYQPDGDSYFLASANAGALVRQIVPLQFTISRLLNGAASGVDRIVVFPVGGNARMR